MENHRQSTKVTRHAALACGLHPSAVAEHRGRAPPATTQSASPTTQATIEAHFSPQEEIAPTIVKLIDSANHSIEVAAFTFSHPDIAKALLWLHDRGVQVQFVMDYTQSRLRTCLAGDLTNAGIEVLTRHRRDFSTTSTSS